ncbi:MAG: molybdopterin-synthase adenylyltransferase MoeB [Desulfovibrio sp.]|jgi:adenylyltransferase/sulfurtransferase|nr:molybdopterin-synthase adenylyltransferase MoeB [Desulfovibrio sp.]
MSIIPAERRRALSGDEIARYSRHLILPDVGPPGQERLKAARVLVVGTGGLGAPAALYLAAAGVGVIGLVDFDFVEASNLQRQIIHGTKDIDRPKTASARDRIRDLNPCVEVVTHNTRLSSANALKILGDYDLALDGTDNFPARYLINDACALLGIPDVYGSIFQFEGQAGVFYAREGPCLRCLFPAPPPPGLMPSCGEGGVMGVLPGIIGSIQACEAVKLIVGGGDSLIGRICAVDAWTMRFSQRRFAKDPACPLCGAEPTIRELADYELFCGLRQEEEQPVEGITARELKARMDRGDPLQIIDIREPHERGMFAFPLARAVPFGQLVRRREEFDPSVDAVFICKIGQRSIHAIRSLREAGYEGRMLNLLDGSNAWARDVDTTLHQY